MTSEMQTANTTSFPLVIPTKSQHPMARLVLRNELGQVIQQWLLRHNKCTLGSAPACQLRCTESGIAAYHALIVVGARQTFVRALAPKLLRDGAQVTELLLDETSGHFEIAGHRFELTRRLEAPPQRDPSSESGRMKFTLARPFELTNRGATSSTLENSNGQSAAGKMQEDWVAPWVAKLVRSAVEPIEFQLQNALGPIAELQAESRRQRRRRKKRRMARQQAATAREAEPNSDNGQATISTYSLITAELQAQLESMVQRQSIALEAVGERVSDVSQHLANLDRIASEEAERCELPAVRSEVQTQTAAIEQLRMLISGVSEAVAGLQNQQQTAYQVSQHWKTELEEQLNSVVETIRTAGEANSSEVASQLLGVLAGLQASQAHAERNIDELRHDFQQQMQAMHAMLNESKIEEESRLNADTQGLLRSLASQIAVLDSAHAQAIKDVQGLKEDLQQQLAAVQTALESATDLQAARISETLSTFQRDILANLSHVAAPIEEEQTTAREADRADTLRSQATQSTDGTRIEDSDIKPLEAGTGRQQTVLDSPIQRASSHEDHARDRGPSALEAPFSPIDTNNPPEPPPSQFDDELVTNFGHVEHEDNPEIHEGFHNPRHREEFSEQSLSEQTFRGGAFDKLDRQFGPDFESHDGSDREVPAFDLPGFEVHSTREVHSDNADETPIPRVETDAQWPTITSGSLAEMSEDMALEFVFGETESCEKGAPEQRTQTPITNEAEPPDQPELDEIIDSDIALASEDDHAFALEPWDAEVGESDNEGPSVRSHEDAQDIHASWHTEAESSVGKSAIGDETSDVIEHDYAAGRESDGVAETSSYELASTPKPSPALPSWWVDEDSDRRPQPDDLNEDDWSEDESSIGLPQEFGADDLQVERGMPSFAQAALSDDNLQALGTAGDDFSAELFTGEESLIADESPKGSLGRAVLPDEEEFYGLISELPADGDAILPESSTVDAAASAEVHKIEGAKDPQDELQISTGERPTVSSFARSAGHADASAQEDTVEDYMRRLLARMRGVPENDVAASSDTKEQHREAAAKPGTSAGRTQTEGFGTSLAEELLAMQRGAASSLDAKTEGPLIPAETNAVTAAFDPERYLPRGSAHEESHNMAAMRELANNSARTAIDTSTRQRHVTSVLLKLGISSIGFFVAAVLLAINGLTLNIGLIATFASLLVAIIWGYDGFASLRPVLRSGQLTEFFFTKAKPSQAAQSHDE